ADPSLLLTYRSVGSSQFQAGPADADHCGIGSRVLGLKWTVRILPGNVGIGSSISARNENVHSHGCKLQESLMLRRDISRRHKCLAKSKADGNLFQRRIA